MPTTIFVIRSNSKRSEMDSKSNIASELSSDILRRIPSIRAASRSANILVFCFADVFGGIEESFELELESIKSSKQQNALRIGKKKST